MFKIVIEHPKALTSVHWHLEDTRMGIMPCASIGIDHGHKPWHHAPQYWLRLSGIQWHAR